ncbi:hypothetical protein HMPREF0531_10467 [Lactiplantibacillus plantarum subsp. plantarum ATCC 14917 = JCM 1149 = CGMCC 1.2437]|nr:hypothetical protein HMPREF0531_10467 [Lactiplantibacillus plantarum subsp. plantarum ATCC 14917 = JCM 1149 = CGMCC 1.2437]
MSQLFLIRKRYAGAILKLTNAKLIRLAMTRLMMNCLFECAITYLFRMIYVLLDNFTLPQ